MELTDELRKEDRAVAGTQFFLRVTSAPSGANIIGKRLLDAGLLNIVGTYECEIDLQGLAQLECHLMPSAVVGAFAPSLVSYYANRRKPKTTVAGANFANATLQTLALSGLKGEKTARVTFTIPGGGSINFDPTAGAADPQGATPGAQAEANGS